MREGTSLLALFALGLAVEGQAGTATDNRGRIDRVASPLVERGVAVGLVVGVLEGGEGRCLAYGETVLGSGKAPDEDTVYEIGSITKVFTALLLADAVERGAVSLDDPVQKYLPAGVILPVKGAPITLAHLASHTSGLPRLPPNLKPADDANPYADYSVDDLYASLRALRLESAPGRYEYSNYGAGLLGHVLALQAGRPYEELLVERYALTPDFVLEVTLERGQLLVQATGQDKFPVYPSAPGEFFYKVVDAQLSFVAGPGGGVERVVLHQGGRDIEGARLR